MFFFFSFFLSCLICFVLIKTVNLHGKLSFDSINGAQKFHQKPTSRIGGLAIILTFIILLIFLESSYHEIFYIIILCSLPIVIAGFFEDLTKKASANFRLFSTILSGILFTFMSGYNLENLQLNFIDNILSIYLISILFSGFAIGGVTNSINIIDGFNGLASGSLLIIFLGFMYIAWMIGDNLILYISMIMFSAILGFFVFNFPHGKIFLGDAGAYFCGYVLACTAVSLSVRNNNISPYACFLLCSYPITETMISIIRKTIRKGSHPNLPDSLHLHMLVYRSLSRKFSKYFDISDYRNPITSIIMWGFPLASLLFTIISYENSILSVLFYFIILISYIFLYSKLSLINLFKKIYK